jgi:hypothetical protein
MSITNVKTFSEVGRSDVFLLDSNGTYTITTIGAAGGSSDVHVWVANNDLASVDDTALSTNWTLLRDTGLSGEAAALTVTAGSKKLLVDVISPLADTGVVFTLDQTGALSGAFDKSQGLLSANNQRQKFSAGRRRVN